MTQILVAYDGSASSRRALERTMDEARDSHAHITVLSVAEMPLNPEVPRYFGTFDDISAEESGPLTPPPDVIAQLKEARDVLSSAGFDPDLVWAAGEPGREIVDTAKRIGVRLGAEAGKVELAENSIEGFSQAVSDLRKPV